MMGLYVASGSLAQGNARFAAWSGFDNQNAVAFTEASNVSLPPFGDTTALWDFRRTGDNVRGYPNPSGAFPAYTLFPGDTLWSKQLSDKESVVLSLAPAQIPRAISLAYGTAAYPSYTDSTRTHWLRDTTLVISGPASVKALQIQGGVSYGLPLLFTQSGGNFVPGPLGPEGSMSFVNNVPSAKVFIPAFAGQNTPKGTQVAVKGLSPDTALLYTLVSRTGRTAVSAPTLSPENKRWRIIQKSGRSFGLRDTTTAEGSGTVHFGLSKTGADAAWEKDSLTWWLGGTAFATPRDSAGKWWGSTPDASSFQAVLVERLAIGKGVDTLPLAQGRITTRSALGHQLRIDSLYLPTQAEFPDMGHFSKGISFTWPGRSTGDTFSLTLFKSNTRQKAYVRDGATATLVSPVQEDSATVTLSFEVGDTGKVVFLAAVESGLAVIQKDASPSVKLQPDFLRVGNLRLPWGENAVAGRLTFYGVDGQLVRDVAVPRGRSEFALTPSERVPLFGWWTVALKDSGWRRQWIRYF